jgi:outer membrane biosynthesis protein TonB
MLQAKRLLTIFGLIFSLVTGLYVSSVPASSAGSSLIISEINAFGSLNETSCKTVPANNRCAYDKWLEIHNPTPNPINLKGWTLRFRGSSAAGDNLPFIQDIFLAPGGYYLIAYKEINYQSTLQDAGIAPGGLTGKIRNLSNKAQGTIQVSLLDPEQAPVFEANLNAADFPKLLNDSGARYSLEYSGGGWDLATNEFYPNNFGTPKNTANLNLDLDNQRDDLVVVAPTPTSPPSEPNDTPSTPPAPAQPQPQPQPQPEAEPVITPEPQLVPETINQPVTTPTPVVTIAPEPKPAIEPTPHPEAVKVADNLLEPAVQPIAPIASQLGEPLETVETVVSQTSQVEVLIQKQAAVFQSQAVMETAKAGAGQSSSSSEAVKAKSASLSSRQLWEYFFSYQALGILTILFAVSYAFSQRETISQSFSVSYFQYDEGLVLDKPALL